MNIDCVSFTGNKIKWSLLMELEETTQQSCQEMAASSCFVDNYNSVRYRHRQCMSKKHQEPRSKMGWINKDNANILIDSSIQLTYRCFNISLYCTSLPLSVSFNCLPAIWSMLFRIFLFFFLPTALSGLGQHPKVRIALSVLPPLTSTLPDHHWLTES